MKGTQLDNMSEAERALYLKALADCLAAKGFSVQYRTWGFGKKKERKIGVFPIKKKSEDSK